MPLVGAVVVLLAAVALLAQPPTADAQRRGFIEQSVRLWDPGIGRGLAYDARSYRVLHNVPAARNVAVFRYRLPNGEERILAIDSAPFSPGGGKRLGEGHSEERLDFILEQWGIDPLWVEEIYSELEPCAQRGHFCANLLKNKFRNLKGLYWSLEYPFSDESEEAREDARRARNRSVSALRDNVRDLRRETNLPGGRGAARGQNPFGPGRGRLPVLSPHFIPRLPGGIDFSTLELRYVADTGRTGLRYSFRGQPTTATSDPNLGQQNVDLASDSLFAWLTLPPQTFWVNLNPSQPDVVIDPGLARTDAGRVLLESDLLLKRTTVNMMHPDTPLGDRFFDELERLYGSRALEACLSFRVWIVPAPAVVREDGDGLYILDAPLTVMNDSAQIVDPDTGAPGCPQEAPAVEEQKEQLLRTLILPAVTRAVNTEAQYAPLRRVYISRVVAEWLRQRGRQKGSPVSRLIDSGKVGRWVTETPWEPRDVFNRYLDNLRHGEWSTTREVTVNGQTYQRPMVMGGVDFSRTPPRRPVSRREFNDRWPRLAKRVRRSQREAATGNGEVWLGGGGQPAAVRLSVRTRDRRVSPGEVIRYRLRAANPTGAALHDVRVCDGLPSGLAFVRATRRSRVQVGQHCWAIPRIGAHRAKTVEVTARVLNGARGRVVNDATATVADSPSGSLARITFRVAGVNGGGGQPGGVTG